jgi:hypothetical protein
MELAENNSATVLMELQVYPSSIWGQLVAV